MSRETRETLKDFLTQKGSTQNSISITLTDAPSGFAKEPGTGEELLALLDDTRGLLGEYLKFIVDNSSNEYKIKTGNALASSANRGDSIPLADSQGAENIFLEQGTVLKAKLNENSNSNKFDDSGTPLSDLIDKTSKNFTNHNKLKDIEGRPLNISGKTLVNPNGDPSDIVQATNASIDRMLDAGAYCAIASHDYPVVNYALSALESHKMGPGIEDPRDNAGPPRNGKGPGYEFQMLLGVRGPLRRKLAKNQS